ncbi:GxxExxY protein [Spirosoma montaniterrae]|uniref:GxxExxY protein n=1 Tax=Spirosoma montaniterrae TaxID=1178516 RepID=A0A1P9WSR9_9BACT|nr:GxxExxY protein [Spirosoma montaniterrae]AQG78383.1 GxxExxY protein [Spirosoma montaniterrae]
MAENEITECFIGCAMQVHRKLGPGLLESVYEECVAYELSKTGLFVERQKALPVVYETIKLDSGYRVDLLLNRKVIIELKAVEALNEVHLAQLMTYLRLADCRLGLLVNFNVILLKQGIRRVVNNF